MESSTINKTREHSECQEPKPKEDLPNQKLPYELLLILFSYVSIPDLVSLQRVCSGWRAAAQGKKLWKKFTLTVHGTSEDVRNVMIMPALRNINGEADNSLVDIILQNVTELSQMNIRFMPPLSSSQIQNVIEKYPEIKSISIDMIVPDISECVHLLKTSKYLKIVHLLFSSSHRSNNNQLLNALSLYDTLADSKNFPALTNVDACHYVYWKIANDPKFVNGLIDVISKRSQQLLSLKVLVRDIEGEKLVNAVNMCTRLHTLCIKFYEERSYKHSVCLNAKRMTQLKSLSINTFRHCSYLFTFHDSLYMQSWEYIRELDFSTYTTDYSKVDVLRSVIKNMRQLRKLRFIDEDENTNENELKEIGNLSHLKKLSIEGLTSFSVEGMCYLSACRNLRSLSVNAIKSRGSTYLTLEITNMINLMKKLEYLTLRIKSNCGWFLSGRQELDEFVEKHSVIHND